MPAGTIKLTNNSAAVTGTGTSFTTELAANDFLVAVVGGVTYTLGVKSVESNTGLTLAAAYNGPTTTGLAWTPVPNATLVGITAQVAADVAKAIRGMNLDKANWQQVFSGTGNATVNLPDGSQFTGPSWGNITTSLNNKASSGANKDITSLTGLTTPLSTAYGGTGGKSAKEGWDILARYGSTEGTAAQGNDNRLAKVWATINGRTGSIAAGNGVSSVTKSSTGDWTIFFTNGFPDNNYSYSITGFTTGNAINTYGFLTKSPGSMRIRCVSGTDLTDPSQLMIQIFGN